MARLELKSISIRKAPGFRDGLHAPGLDGLAGDINIITGPNGTGKTTIARLIHQLIWPERTVSADIHGAYMINEEPWTVHLDPTARIVQKDGTDSMPAGIPPKELQKVYMLALHELVGQDDKDLAGRILRESIGGYDLDRASSDLKYSGETRNKRSKEYSDFNKISETVIDLTKAHSELKGDEENLSQLEESRLGAMKAGEFRSLYEKAVQYRIAEEEAAALETRLDAFPAVLNNVSGDEQERIKELEEESEREKSVVEAAGKTIAEEEEKILELALPAEGIDDRLLFELDSGIREIQETGRLTGELETEIIKLETEETRTRESISNIRRTEEWKGLKLVGAEELDVFFHKSLALMQKEISIRTELEMLEREEAEIGEDAGTAAAPALKTDPELTADPELTTDPGLTTDPDKLKRGIDILGDWLKETRPFRSVQQWLFIVLSLAGILTAAAIYFSGIYGFAGAALILAILIYGLARNSSRNIAENLKVRENDYVRTGLKQPVEWETGMVTAVLGELIGELNKVTAAAEERRMRQARIKDLRTRLDSLDVQIREMNNTRENLLEKFRAMPDFPESAEETISPLFLFLTGLKKWQSAYISLLSLKESLTGLQNRRKEEIEKCNAVFRKLGISILVLDDSANSGAAVTDSGRPGELLTDSGLSAGTLTGHDSSDGIWTDNSRTDGDLTKTESDDSDYEELQINLSDYSLKARALFQTLSAAENKRREAVREIANQKKLIAYSEARISETHKRIRALYETLETEAGNFAEVIRIMEDYPLFKAVQNDYNTASMKLSIKENELRGHSLYGEHEAVLDEISLFEAQTRADELEKTAAGWGELNEAIISTKTLIEDKKRGAELETALAQKKNAGDELEKLYVSNLSSMTGFLLAGHLRRETANLIRPEVLKRADRIFSLITRGRYNLRVSNEDGPVFRAFDNVINLGLGLDELSTGTRVQLLLAARLAFVESIENDVQLPLLADELLANSDDIRADAIIEALCGISSEGRQVFYFTAQPDEVEKWLSYLNKRSDISYRVIQLGGPGNGESPYGVHRPAIEGLSFVHKTDGPGNRNMNEYRELLGIRPYDLIRDETAGLSLSFLTGDVKLFHDCLVRGIATWGQLNAFYEAGGEISGNIEKLIGEMRKKTDLLESFQKLYRQGRSRPVSIDAVIESGTVTERFIEEVREKLDELKGDPHKLIEVLDTIRNFRTDKKEQLREYLTGRGYIDESATLDEDDLRLRLQARAEELGIEMKEAEDFINGIVKFSGSD